MIGIESMSSKEKELEKGWRKFLSANIRKGSKRRQYRKTLDNIDEYLYFGIQFIDLFAF